MSKLSRLIWSMLKIGTIGFGGGNSLIPVIEKEVVTDQKMVKKDELDSEIMVASITPGALPVEIACGIGKRINNRIGMLASTTAITIPGVLFCLILLGLLNMVSINTMNHIVYYSFGINLLIICLLFQFVINVLKDSVTRGRKKQDFALCAIVCLLTGVNKIIKLIGVEIQYHFEISIILMLFITFFYILYVKTVRTQKRNMIAIILIGITLFLHILSQVGFRIKEISIALYIVMSVLAIYGIYGDIKQSKVKLKFNWNSFLKDELVWLCFLITLSLPAFVLCDNSFAFMKDGLASSFLSYGGGDAYLSIADEIFVEGNVISESDFYGKVVVIANILPGSILCKVLSSIGFLVGLENYGTYGHGIALAMQGFAISIFGSVTAFLIVRYIIECYETLKCFQLLKIWSRPIIGGMLIPITCSLLTKCNDIAFTIKDVSIINYIMIVVLLVAGFILLRLKRIPFIFKFMIMAFAGRVILLV